MKKLYTILLVVLFTITSFAQAPQGVNYQSVVRDNLGAIIANTAISVEFKLHKTTISGTVVYTETHSVTTSDYGVFNIVVGQGSTTDNFTAIDWSSDSYFLETGIDVTGGTTYGSLGTTEMMSVPYALHARTVETGDNLGNHTATQDLSIANNSIIDVNNLTTGTVFSTAANATINTTTPNGSEGIIMSGSSSDYIISVQDGNGRVQHKWNASYGTGETYIKGAEDAAFIDINATASDDNTAWIEFKHADGATASAGQAISWNTQLIINQGGEVGINETSPDDMLHVTSGGNGTRLRAENSGNGWAGVVAKNIVREMFVGIQGAFDANPGEFHIYDNTAGARRFVIDAAGEVGIGRNNPSVKLDVNGSVNCTGGTCSSDKRWKKNIISLPNVIENIKQMRGVSYNWRTKDFPDQNFTNDKQIGLIAQEVEKVYPELVKTNNEGYKSMDYMSLTAILLEAVKEQQKDIEKLKMINTLQSRNNKTLEERLVKIETLLNTDTTSKSTK